MAGSPRFEIEVAASTNDLKKGIQDAKKLLKDFQGEVGKVNNQKITTSFDKTSISGMKESLKELTKEYNELSSNARGYSRVNAEIVGEIKRLQTEIDNASANIKRQGSSFQATSGSYNEAQQRLTALGKAIRSTTDGFTSNSPAIQAQINEYNALNTKLKEFDARLGNNQRNVGNYGSALGNANGVALEFNRIIQDAPFGMIGIGNNLQQLAENWKNYSIQARAAGAQTGQTVNGFTLFKGALSSIISPINLFSLGISLVTSGITAYTLWQQKAKKATKEAQETLEDQIKSLDSSSRASAEASSNYSKELTQLNYLYGVIQSGTASRQQQTLAVEELQKLYPNIFNNLTQEAILAEEGARAYDKLRDSIVRVGIAEAAKKLGATATEDYVKNVVAGQSAEADALKLYNEYNRAIATRNLLQNKYNQFLGQTVKVNGLSFKVQKDNSLAITQLNTIINDLGRQYTEANNKTKGFVKSSEDASKKIQEYNKVAIENGILTEKQTGLISELQRKIGDLESKRPFLKTKEDITSNVNETNLLKKELKSLETVTESQVGLIGALQDKLKQLNKERPFLKNKQDIEENIKSTNKYKKELEDLQKGLKKPKRSGTGATTIKNYLDEVKAISQKSDFSVQIADSEGLDKQLERNKQKYKAFLDALDKIEKQNRGKNVTGRLTTQNEIDKTRSQINNDQIAEESAIRINYAQKTEDTITQILNDAGISRIKSRQQELDKSKNNFDELENKYRDNAKVLQAITEARKLSEAAINEKYDAKAYEGVQKMYDKINKLETKPFAKSLKGEELTKAIQDRLKEIEDLYKKIAESLATMGVGNVGESQAGLLKSFEKVTKETAPTDNSANEVSKYVKNAIRRSVGSTIESLFSDLGKLTESNYEIEEKYAKLRQDASAEQIVALQKQERLEKQINNGFTNLLTNTINSLTSIGTKTLSTAVGEGFSTGDFSQLKGLFSGDKKAVGYGMAAATLGSIISGNSKSKGASILGGALSGAGTGAALGSIVPGIGTAIGAIGGAIIGGVSGLLNSNKAKKQEELQRLQLEEQKKQVALQTRANQLAYQSSVIGQLTNQGAVSSIERDAFGNLVATVQGSQIQLVLDRAKSERG